MTATHLPPGYALRPGSPTDLASVTNLYLSTFGHDRMLDIMFPTRRQHPRDVQAFLYRHFQRRYWTLGWRLTVLVDETLDVPVGFTWWLRPKGDLSFWERWISPYGWFAPLVRAYISARSLLARLRSPISPDSIDVFVRTIHAVEPRFLTTPRREQAWYLSTLSVHPVYQGRRLGETLLQEGLGKVDSTGAASYLIGLRSVERFYPKYGFREVCRANVGELEEWDGGGVMFRE
ncbi:hypothetical protein QQS21_008902 [Conoideocrella luteorostrata]|uniref:N-acetyltransferase domain-containing protein n=1 Tax=Conoideocrella luteorostrata TaxID=1105319 RepID=A0AAJ0FVK2_9HYPO|nr:hypothetical protein QQS21_008902 [Conoideocrella luteorostrata]